MTEIDRVIIWTVPILDMSNCTLCLASYIAKIRDYSQSNRGTQREYSSKPLNLALLNVF